MFKRILAIAFIVTVVFLLASCTPKVEENALFVSVIADGRERIFQLNDSFTVEEFISQEDVGVTLNDNDRITPPRFTQLTDGMRITIVRITDEVICEREEIPFEQEIVLNEGLATGEERIAQVGQTGTQEICYRVEYENGVERQRLRDGQPTIITEPVNEILIIGLETELEPIPIEGTLAYINNGNVWAIKGNSTTKQPLTTSSDLDSLVLSLSPDGRYVMYTKTSDDEDAFVNELWLIETNGNTSPIRLVPTDVLYAEWVALQENVISYSTSEVQDLFPGWRALNNVWSARIDPSTGETLSIEEILPESGGGLSGWWGTVYQWSPDGDKLAWVRADSSGIINDGEFITLAEYAPFRTSQPWSWRASISWSADSELLATTVHGAPIGNEPPDTSPVFNVSVVDVNNTFQADVIEGAGMWASPKFSPAQNDVTSQFVQGYLAYLKARSPYNSVNGEYELVVADRDGSNARTIFPDPEQPGIITNLLGLTSHDYAWSPDGKQIALIYQGNLWVVDIETTVSHQLTFDGQSQYPVWSR